MHQWASRDLDNLWDHLCRVFLIRNWSKSMEIRDIDSNLDMIDRKSYLGTLDIQNWQFRDLSIDFNLDKTYAIKPKTHVKFQAPGNRKRREIREENA